MTPFKLTIQSNGAPQEVEFSLDMYAAAAEAGLTLSQYLNRKVPTTDNDPGTAFEQCMARSGIILSEDRHFGLRAPTIHDVLTGKAELNSSSVVRPDGSERFTPAGRYFFPQVLIDLLESELREDRSSSMAGFMEMVAYTRSITSSRYDQVKIDYTRPRETRAQPISQLAEPTRLLSITTSSVQRALPTWSVGIEISDQAAQAATLDLVQIALREHGAEERWNRMHEDFLGIVNGNADAGEDGVISNAVSVTAYDPSISQPRTLTQLAWVKFLMRNWMRRRISHIVCSINSYMAIEKRADRPNATTEWVRDERLNTTPAIGLELIPANVRIFPMEDFPDDLLVGVDASKAMRRIVQVSANYSAIEAYVMRRSTAFRIDTSERIESIGYPQAFELMTLIGQGGTT